MTKQKASPSLFQPHLAIYSGNTLSSQHRKRSTLQQQSPFRHQQQACQNVRRPQARHPRARPYANVTQCLTTPSSITSPNAPKRVQQQRGASCWMQRLVIWSRICRRNRPLPLQSPLAQMRPRRHIRKSPKPHSRPTKAQAR
jgi:hypothetical protein